MHTYTSCYAIRAALRAVLISGVATLRGLRPRCASSRSLRERRTTSGKTPCSLIAFGEARTAFFPRNVMRHPFDTNRRHRKK